MLIQCQSCATRYRVDLARLPRRKTFIRCKNCGTPIYLDPDLEGAETAPGAPLPPGGTFVPGATAGLALHGSGAAGLATRGAAGAGAYLPPQAGEPGGGEAPHAHDGELVQCPQCRSRYRVPASALQRPHIKLKCSVCAHVFAPSAAEPAEGEEGLDSLFDGLRATPAGPGAAGARLTDGAVNRLQGAPGGGAFAPEPEELDPELAYLDAVALEGEEAPGPAVGKVPEDQKYQLFLKPDQFRAARDATQPPVPPVAPPVPPASGPPARGRAAAPVEAESFDHEEAPPRAAAPPVAPAEPAAKPPAPKPASDAQEANEWELPPLDDEPEPEPVAASDEGFAGVMDLELPPPSARPAAAGRGQAKMVDANGLELTLDELPPLEDLAAAPAIPPDSVRRESTSLDTTGLPTLEDVELDLDDLETDAARAVRTADIGHADLPPLEPPGTPSPALDLGALDDLPPLADLEPPPPRPMPGPAETRLPAIIPAPSGAKGAGLSGAKGAGPGKEPPTRLVVPGQGGWFTDRRRVLAAMVVAGVIVGAIVTWGGWMMGGDDDRPFAFEFGRTHQLALQEDLTGRAVPGRNGRKLFVVEGRLVNRFPPGVRIGWIRVRGTIYADHGQSHLLGATQAYLGNVLSDAQLQTMAPDAIAAFGAYTNGRKDVNFDIPSGAAVPFQLVFLDVPSTVARTVVQVIGYTREGLAVYLDAPGGDGR
jgi:predicted Zn finger-like uncharacterized protein